jgi:SOS-response transcriptional repressor LexA
MGVKERLLDFINYKQITNKLFELTAGLSNGYINNFDGNFRTKTLEKVLTAYPELNRNWLLYGEGEMLLTDDEVITPEPIEADGDASISIPVVTDVVLSKRGIDIKHYIEKNGSELQSIDPYKLFEGAEFAVEMFKDSMAPDIMAGDKVILQFLPKDAKLQSGAMYFINSITYADVVRDVFIDGDIATLKARNKRYGDIVLNIKTDILRVANVLGIYRNTFSSSYAQLDELRERKDAQMDKMLDMMKTQTEQQDKLINFITKTK